MARNAIESWPAAHGWQLRAIEVPDCVPDAAQIEVSAELTAPPNASLAATTRVSVTFTEAGRITGGERILATRVASLSALPTVEALPIVKAWRARHPVASVELIHEHQQPGLLFKGTHAAGAPETPRLCWGAKGGIIGVTVDGPGAAKLGLAELDALRAKAPDATWFVLDKTPAHGEPHARWQAVVWHGAKRSLFVQQADGRWVARPE